MELVLTEAHHPDTHPQVVAIGKDGVQRDVGFGDATFWSGKVVGEEDSYTWLHRSSDTGLLSGSIHIGDDEYHIEPSWRHPQRESAQDSDMIVYSGKDLIWPKELLGDMSHATPHATSPGSFCGQTHEHRHLHSPTPSNHGHGGHAYTPGAQGTGTQEGTAPAAMTQPHAKAAPLLGSDPALGRERARRNGAQFGLPRDTCYVTIVADERFFRSNGGSTASVSAIIMQYMAFVDMRIRAANVEGGPYGIAVKKMVIYESKDRDPFADFNTPSSLLKALSDPRYAAQDDSNPSFKGRVALKKDEKLLWNHHESCLVHLFTGAAFTDDPAIGLAYTGNTDMSAGACHGYGTPNRQVYYNTAFTTDKSFGAKLPAMMHNLVAVHEFGHNFGSPHDADYCVLNSDKSGEGRFLMWPQAVDGSQSNNHKFSDCSRSGMFTVMKLLVKENNCLVPRPTRMCGNGIVDVAVGPNVTEADIEECDSGSIDGDDCCTEECKFTKSAVCSDANSICCRGCQPAPTTTRCFQEFDLDSSCRATEFCDGTSPVCPETKLKPMGTACLNHGVCTHDADNSKRCVGWCERHGASRCSCTGAESCDVCCQLDFAVPPMCNGDVAGFGPTSYDATTNNCTTANITYAASRPFPKQCTSANAAYLRDVLLASSGVARGAGAALKLGPGTSCEGGVCNTDGACTASKTDAITTVGGDFADIFSGSAISWGRKNLVGAVLLVVGIFWIPGALVYKHSRKRQQSRAHHLKRTEHGRAYHDKKTKHGGGFFRHKNTKRHSHVTVCSHTLISVMLYMVCTCPMY